MLSAHKIKPLHTQLVLFGTFITFGLTIALVSFFLSSYLQTQTLIEKISVEAHSELRAKQRFFSDHTTRSIQALDAAQHCDFFARYQADRQSARQRDKAEQCLLTITNALTDISQLRYIDETGMERIRINKASANTVAYPIERAHLQNKASRYYSQEIAKHPYGSYWFSALDLNMEYGQLEQPLNPTLRIGTPIYHNGQYQGFIIMNLRMLPTLERLIESPLFDAMLANGKGQILLQNTQADDSLEHLWAGVAGEAKTLHQYWPDIANIALGHTSVFEHQGRFSLSLEESTHNTQGLTLLLDAKPSTLSALENKSRQYLVLVTLAIIICSLLLGLSFSGMLARLNRKLVTTREALGQQMALVDRYIPIIRTDKQGVVTKANHAFCSLLGFHEEELLGRDYRLCRHQQTSIEEYEEIWETLRKNRPWQGEFQDQQKDGSTIWLSAYITSDYDPLNHLYGYTAIFRDISNRKELEKQALTDPLTGLYNRRHFDTCCTRELRRCARENSPLGLALIDTDCFKQYNDTFGHDAGDQILIKIAQCMIQGLHRASDFAFRIGGDEFAILFSGLNPEQTRALLERVRTALEQLKIQHPGNDSIGVVTISLGAALILPDKHNLQVELFQAADDALYQAKNSGRNQVCILQLPLENNPNRT